MSATPLAEYLEIQPGTTFMRLYQQPSTTLAIFRRNVPHLGIAIFVYKGKTTDQTSQILCYGFVVHDQTASTERS